jgi:hypothetical protein
MSKVIVVATEGSESGIWRWLLQRTWPRADIHRAVGSPSVAAGAVDELHELRTRPLIGQEHAAHA